VFGLYDHVPSATTIRISKRNRDHRSYLRIPFYSISIKKYIFLVVVVLFSRKYMTRPVCITVCLVIQKKYCELCSFPFLLLQAPALHPFVASIDSTFLSSFLSDLESLITVSFIVSCPTVIQLLYSSLTLHPSSELEVNT
jgi:hypothetical protein